MTVLKRTRSWAESITEVEERRQHAQLMVGAILTSVRYVNIDYERLDRLPASEGTGPRNITDPTEWDAPLWSCPGFDAVDYGIDLVMEDGRIFSVTWDTPGRFEGIGIRAEPLLSSGFLADADVAIWDVSRKRRWQDKCTRQVTQVDLNYEPWGLGGGFWCPSIRISFQGSSIELELGEPGTDCVPIPSSNNIIVR